MVCTRSVSLTLLAVSLAGLIYGQAENVSLVVQVVNSFEAPIPGVVVTLTPMTESPIGTGTPTDDNGRAEFNVAKAARYSIHIGKSGFGEVEQILEGALPEQMRFTLRPAAAEAIPTPQPETMMAPPSGTSGASESPFPQFPSQPSQAAGPAKDFKTQLRESLVLLALALIPLGAFFGIRELVVRAVVYFMMKKGRASSETPAIALQEAAPGLPATLPGELQFLEVNGTNGVILNGHAEDRRARSESMGRRMLIVFLWSMALHFFLSLVILAVAAEMRPDLVPVAGIAAGVSLGVTLIGAILALNGYLAIARLEMLVAMLSVVFCGLLGLAGWQFGIPPYLALLPTIALAGFLYFGLRRLRKITLNDPNRELLILRVFGSDKNTAYTFGKLMQRWRFVGSFLTIVDPSYIRHQFTVFSLSNTRRTLGTTIWYSLAALALFLGGDYIVGLLPGLFPSNWATLPSEDKMRYLQAGASIVLAPLSILPILLYVRSRFASSSEKATNRLKKHDRKSQHLRLGGIFNGLPMFCFDDVWKPAVRTMLERANVVLMDLRGFTAERRGCAYEIGELIDRYPIERVLFLLDDKSPSGAVYALIRERWAAMRSDSPNHALPGAIVKVYQTSKRDKGDIHRILALLSASADAVPGAGTKNLLHWSAGRA
jgi:hypothetical protein